MRTAVGHDAKHDGRDDVVTWARQAGRVTVAIELAAPAGTPLGTVVVTDARVLAGAAGPVLRVSLSVSP